jgi:hypothetical protein
MAGWVIVVVTVVVVALPPLLLAWFNGGHVADARGRRINSRWHSTRSRRRPSA